MKWCWIFGHYMVDNYDRPFQSTEQYREYSRHCDRPGCKAVDAGFYRVEPGRLLWRPRRRVWF